MSNTILSRLEKWATVQRDQKAFIFLNSAGEEEEALTFFELFHEAKKIAFLLSEQVQPRERILLLFPPGLNFIKAFLGSLLAGVIAVPLPPPMGRRQKSRALPIIENAECVAILSQGSTVTKYASEFNLPCIDIALAQSRGHRDLIPPDVEDVAFLQYTSGSTGLPKGVMIDHGQLFHHQEILYQAFGHTKDSIVAGWLPFYHDMGLVGNILHPIHAGLSCILMAPLTFLNSPIRWLEAISKYKATTSGGPNFAYDLCATRINVEEVKGLDLSSWKIAFNGSEITQLKTMNQFSSKFESVNFHHQAFYPCYGLAESTLFVCGPKTRKVKYLNKNDGSQNTKNIVCCGSTRGNEKVKIVDPNTEKLCCEGQVGEIWVKGKSVSKGYWRNPEQTEKTFDAWIDKTDGPYLRTGDLGFIEDDEVYPLGRIKNLIIIRGKNFYPNDLESCSRRSNSLIEQHLCAAFSISNENGEKLVIVQEISRTLKDEEVYKNICKCVRKALSEEYNIRIDAIFLVPQNSIPRTTSGKVQYYLLKELLLKNELKYIYTPQSFQSTCSLDKENIRYSSLEDLCATVAGVPLQEFDEDEPLIHLGIDSLGASKITLWIFNQYKKQIEISEILSGSSLNKLRKMIDTAPEHKSSSAIQQVNMEKQRTFPLSYSQENVWAIHQLNPTTTAYNIVGSLAIKGDFDVAYLESAFIDLMNQHSALRTGFKDSSSGPLQVIKEKLHPYIEIHNYIDTKPHERDEHIKKVILDEASYVFDLEIPPLFRVHVILISSNHMIIVLNIHHLIADGESINIILHDLLIAYEARSQGKTRKIKSRVGQYAEYTLWSQSSERTIQQNRGLAFWKEKLESDHYPILQISPFQKTHANSSQSRSKVLEAELPFSISDKLKSWCKKHNVTLASVLLSVYHTLLHIYTNDSDVFIGYPSSNRGQPEFQDSVGFFVNTLVSKTKLVEESSFKDILTQVSSNLWDGEQFAFVPFQDVVRVLNPPRLENITPIFQAFFVMQNVNFEKIKSRMFTCEVLGTESVSPMYDIVLEIQQKSQGIQLIFEFAEEKIDGFTSKSFRDHYIKILDDILNDGSEIPISSYNLTERNFVKDLDFNIPSNNMQSVVDLIHQQVSKTPDSLAIVSDNSSYTYDDLEKKSSKIAHALTKNGIQKQQPIGIALPRSPELIAALLGVLKAGGVYVPLDLSLPKQRLKAILNETSMRIAIGSTDVHGIFQEFGLKMVNPTQLKEQYSSYFSLATADQTAYIIYTSGSTGNPKGVMVSNKSLLNFVIAAQKIFTLSQKSKVLQFSSINWDTASEEIYPTLSAGGCLILRGNNKVETFTDLIERTIKHHITVWNLPSSYFHDLTDYLLEKKLLIPSSLSLVIIGGEQVSRSKIEKWQEISKGRTTLLNTYGSTETTSISTYFDMAKWKNEWIDAPIGIPIDNTGAYIMNQSLVPLPPGIEGELCIAGQGLAQGYYNNERLTREKFLFSDYLGLRIYRTGDRAYLAPSGDILIRGRSDRLVKRRGFRIELEEIERALLSLETVKNCVILQERQEIWAFIVLVGNKENLPHNFKRELSKQLPEYMLPDKFIFCDKLPRLFNGKVDYIELKKIGQSYNNLSSNFNDSEVPTDQENEILDIWENLLGTKVNSVHSNFFDIGGDSLKIIRLHSKLQDYFRVKFNVSILFSHSTCHAQALFLQSLISNKKETNLSTLNRLELLKELQKGNIDSSHVKELLGKSHKG